MEFNFRKLNVYYQSLDLVELVYEKVGQFPKEEKYALGDQLRRAVVSVPSNIAEGVGRGTDKEKAHFISMAYSSLMEVLCQMEIAYRVNYINEDELKKVEERIETVAKMLSGLRNKLSNVSQLSTLNTLQIWQLRKNIAKAS